MLLSLGLGWPGPLQALNNLKIPPPSYLRCCSLALTAGSHSQSGQCPGRLEARSEACSALSLKPKQDYLFNFPNRTFLSLLPVMLWPEGCLVTLCGESTADISTSSRTFNASSPCTSAFTRN